MAIVKGQIANALTSLTGVVTTSEEVYDENQGQNQQTINAKIVDSLKEINVSLAEAVYSRTVTWGADSNIDKLIGAGFYRLKGERLSTSDGLPILNSSPGHTIDARLIVLNSSLTSGTGESDDACITQVLMLSNRTAGDGDIYIRTGRGSDPANVATITWEAWGKLQQNIEVGQVSTLDNLIDNGVYSGVLVESVASILTFVMIVINNYAVASSAGVTRSISQFRYALNVDGTVSYRTRTGAGSPVTWGEWSDITGSGGSSITVDSVLSETSTNPVQNKVVTAKLASIETVGKNNQTAITAETTRATEAETALGKSFYSESSLSFSKGALQKNSNPYSGTSYNAYSESIAQPFKIIVSDAYYISRVKGVDAEGATQVWTTYTKNDNIKEYSASDSLTYQIEIARVDAATFTDYSDVVKFFGVDKAAKNAASIEELRTLIDEAVERGRQLAKRDLYIAAGATYNDTGADVDKGVLKDASGDEVMTCFDADGNLMYEEDGVTLKYSTVNVIHKAGCYYLNGIGDLSESDMEKIYSAGLLCNNSGDFYYQKAIRTCLPSKSGTSSYHSYNGLANFLISSVETVRWQHQENYRLYMSNQAFMFSGCTKLKYVLTQLAVNNGNTQNGIFENCGKLVHAKLYQLRNSVSFANSPYISEKSIVFLVNNALAVTGTTAITVTLHADAYERLGVETEGSAVYEALTAKNATLTEGGYRTIDIVSA